MTATRLSPSSFLRRLGKKARVVVIVIAVASLAGAGVLAASTFIQNVPTGLTADGALRGPGLGAVVDQALDLWVSDSRVPVPSADGRWLYVSADDGIRIYNASDLSDWRESAGLGESILLMSGDGKRLFAVTDSPMWVVAMDIGENGDLTEFARLPASWSTGGFNYFAASPSGDRLYVATIDDSVSPPTGVLLVLDVDRTKLLRSVPTVFGADVVTNPVTGEVFTSSPDGHVQKLSADGDVLLTGDSGASNLAISRDGSSLYVGHRYERRITRIWTDDLSVISETKVGGHVGMIGATTNPNVVLLQDGNFLSLVDLQAGTTLTRMSIDDHLPLIGVAYGADGHHIFAGPTRNQGLGLIDVSASRTNWAGFWGLLAGLLLLPFVATWMAIKSRRWIPAFAAVRAHRREVAFDEQRRRTAHSQQAEDGRRAAQIQEWQRAYALANNGATPPAGFAPAFTISSDRTNTMAILALIFGFGGGLLGIVFGHMALAQIARTGERGRGLAIAGLLFGYAGLLVLLVVAIFYLSALSRL